MASLPSRAVIGNSSLPFLRASAAVAARVAKLTGSQQRAKFSAVAWGLAAPVIEAEVDAIRTREQTRGKRRAARLIGGAA